MSLMHYKFIKIRFDRMNNIHELYIYETYERKEMEYFQIFEHLRVTQIQYDIVENRRY